MPTTPTRSPCGSTSLGLAVLVLVMSAEARGGDVMLTLGPHILLADTGEAMGAAFDLTFDAAWTPIPEVAVGLEAALMVPLHTGEESRTTELTLRATPAVWLRFGDDQGWGFVKAGLGLDSHLRDGALEPVFALVGAAGYVVAPRQLLFYFGFEITAEVELLGPTTRTVGLGGFVGYRF